MFEKIGTFLGGIALAVAGFFGVTPAQETKIVEVPQSIPYEQVATPQKQILTVNSAADEETLGGFSPAAGGTYRLRTSIGSTDTSITLSSFKEPITGNAFTMTTLNTDIGYATLDPQSPTRKELISFTGVTQSSDGSAVLTGVSRGLAFQYPYTASSTLRKSHPGQSILILSDAPQVFNEYGRLRSNEIVTGQWTFSTFPITPSTTPASATTTGSSQLATGLQAASSTAFGSTGHRLALSTLISTSTGGVPYTIPVTDGTGKISGASCCSGTSTFAATYTYIASSTFTGATLPQAAFTTSSGTASTSNANGTTTSSFSGFALTSASIGGNVSVQTSGLVPGFSGLTKGAVYYTQGTDGTIGLTPTTYSVKVGVAVSTTEILIQKENRILTGSLGVLGTVSGGRDLLFGFRPRMLTITAVSNRDLASSNQAITNCIWTPAGLTGVHSENGGTTDSSSGLGCALYGSGSTNFMTFGISNVSAVGATITWTESGTYAPDTDETVWTAYE